LNENYIAKKTPTFLNEKHIILFVFLDVFLGCKKAVLSLQ
jgi:hypothetical protein